MIYKLHMILAGVLLLTLVGCGQDEIETTANKVEDSLHNAAVATEEAIHAASDFNQVLSQQGISFHVTCPNSGSINQLTIKPSGLAISNRTIEQEIDGTVSGAEIADINSDGSPEIYVYVTLARSGSYGELVAYSSNNKKSISVIYLAPLAYDSINSQGYMGHDKFSIAGSELRRQFPIYTQNDANANPSGGVRQLQYKLFAGEACWQLKLTGSTSLQ